jgi:hypothetical protein
MMWRAAIVIALTVGMAVHLRAQAGPITLPAPL